MKYELTMFCCAFFGFAAGVVVGNLCTPKGGSEQ